MQACINVQDNQPRNIPVELDMALRGGNINIVLFCILSLA